MANDFFTETGDPVAQSRGVSSLIRNLFTAVGNGFAKLAALTGNGGKLVRVNAGETAYEALTIGSGLTVSGSTMTVNPGVGLGEVLGAASSTDGALVAFNGVTGKIIRAAVSGTDIKTVGGFSLLGSGDVIIGTATALQLIRVTAAGTAIEGYTLVSFDALSFIESPTQFGGF